MAWGVIRAADLVATPWPNGRGITRDYVTRMNGDSLVWKVTLAELTEDAPFSVMPFERVFTVVSGGAVELTIDGVATSCDRMRPVRFSGVSTTTCRLLAGPAQAFNLMHEVRVAAEVTPMEGGELGPGEHVVWCPAGGANIAGLLLGPGDAAVGHGVQRFTGTVLVASIA